MSTIKRQHLVSENMHHHSTTVNVVFVNFPGTKSRISLPYLLDNTIERMKSFLTKKSSKKSFKHDKC